MYVAQQKYRLGGTVYHEGRVIPDEVVEKHGLINVSGGPAAEPYPEDFPQASALQAAGFETAEDAQSATDEQLDSVDGIGPATIEDIRAYSL